MQEPPFIKSSIFFPFIKNINLSCGQRQRNKYQWRPAVMKRQPTSYVNKENGQENKTLWT
jgi:hypothetical protein